MDFILSKVTQQAMNYAIRSGITITGGYAFAQCTRLMKTQDGRERGELERLQRRLDSKIRIISPAIDMIELISARGNTSLESCVSLTKSLRLDIQNLGNALAQAAADGEASRSKGGKASSKAHRDEELRVVVAEMKALLQRLEDAVPLINLAITTSGVSLSTNLPASVSPSRLLQASTFLSAGDAAYGAAATVAGEQMQIGPTFTLCLYMLFLGHSQLQDEEGLRQATWQEVVHKARVKLVRTTIGRLGQFRESERKSAEDRTTGLEGDDDQQLRAESPIDEFAYQLELIEDLDDDRVHTLEEHEARPGPFEGVRLAGIRELIPIHEISKIFYADTGKILNINTEGESNEPILLLKRDMNAIPPRKMMSEDWDDTAQDFEGSDDTKLDSDDTTTSEQDADHGHQERINGSLGSTRQRPWSLPAGVDPEWLALEVYNDEAEEDSESESEVEDSPGPRRTTSARQGSIDARLSSGLSNLHLSSPASESPMSDRHAALTRKGPNAVASTGSFSSLLARASGGIRTSLSLLEMLIRLTSLQQFQQASHLTINDELLNFFLEESSTTGAASGDTDQRKRIRMEARQRMGFDPYNESPIKRRGERRAARGSPATSQASTPVSTRESTPLPDGVADTPDAFRHRNLLFKQSSRMADRTPRASSSPSLRSSPVGDSSRTFTSLATPPDTTNNREAFLREEKAKARLSSSPLARKSASSGS